jgi:D-3-phosphoglycerate dehydrogenase
VRFHDGDETLSTAGLIDAAHGCDVIVTDRMTPGGAELFGQLPQLVAFVRCAMDVRNVDVPAASRHGVLVTRASPGWISAVAELVVGQMICLARRIPEAVITYRRGQVPDPAMGIQLHGRTVGIIGYGHLGQRLAKVTHALGMHVLVADPYVADVAPFVTRVSLSDLASASDFVVCLAAHTDETENLVDGAILRRMKPSAFFLNASRGGLVDELALEEALATGRIRGAALDVGRAEDNLPSSRLARIENVVSTPHIGGFVPEAVAHQALETVGQVAEILEGRIPAGALNADSATRLLQTAHRPAKSGSAA